MTDAEGSELVVLPDAEAVAHRGATVIAERARAAVERGGAFTLAVSGGRTPWLMFRALDREEMPWAQTTVFQVDERIAPEGDPARNLTHLRESLPNAALERLRALPVDEVDLEAAAARYAALLPPALDLVHLGLGDDGHTASLVPGDPVLEVGDRDVAVTGAPYQGTRRMTLTYRVLDRAAEALFVVTGAEKRAPLARLLARDGEIPAGRVRTRRILVLADAEAAGVRASVAEEQRGLEGMGA